MHGAKQAEAENAIKKSTFLLPKVRYTRLAVKASPATNNFFFIKPNVGISKHLLSVVR
jgi:hypothetical protein